MVDRNYGTTDFPSFSDGFDNPKLEPFISTELEPNPFTVQDIFDLGFVRTNPNIVIYFHSTKPRLYLEEKGFINFLVKDRIDKQVVVYCYDNDTVMEKHILYSSNKPDIEAIKKVIDDYVV